MHGPDWSLPLSDVTDAVVLASLSKIWTTKTETAPRLRGRIERIWDSARADGLVTGNNPARRKSWLDLKLPPASKVAKKRHFAAMPYADVPAFMADLGTRKGTRAEALRFTILTAARTSEVTGLSWPEVKGDVWTIDASRMKAGKPHVVPLSKQAQEILGRLPKDSPPFLLSENAMLFLLQKEQNGMGLSQYTVHGFRSAFSDWAHEQTAFPSNVIEMALAHTIKNKTEAAYRRGNLLEKRRELMQAWADYCSFGLTLSAASC
jgi:integrase